MLKEQGIKWISCKDAQPEPNNKSYLVTYIGNDDKRYVDIFSYGNVVAWQSKKRFGPIWYVGDPEEFEECDDYTDIVIAWAEFPKPYEGE